MKIDKSNVAIQIIHTEDPVVVEAYEFSKFSYTSTFDISSTCRKGYNHTL